MWRSDRRRALAGLAILAVVAACSSDADDVCENVGNCAHGGSSDWIQACQDEAKLLSREAAANGCGSALDVYYACARSRFGCEGATAVFPGCDASRSALDLCLSSAGGRSSCGMLATRSRACTTPPATPDAGAEGPDSLACTAARDCQARCFLDSVGDVCAPRVDELSAFTACAASCPP